MILRVFLSGNRFVEKKGATNEQINAFMAAYDNKDTSRVELTDADGSWHINKRHIIAIAIEPDEISKPSTILLN